MHILLRATLRLLAAMSCLWLLLFVLGGNLHWPEARLFFCVLLATVVANMLILRHDTALLAERMKPMYQPGQRLADRVLLTVFGILYLAWYIVMPLDAQRLQLSPDFPLWLKLSGACLAITGCTLVVICMAQNSYLSMVVRIQQERGHQLVDSGLYAFVRHPMYLGVFLLLLGGPLLLGSLWGTLVGICASVILGWRSVFEEQLLARELPGYAEYMNKVRWRLLPGLF
jgi:protein-S-isoprenylcysteine O-methyltransferase Ste14